MATTLTCMRTPCCAAVVSARLPKSGPPCRSLQLAAASRTSHCATHCRAGQLQMAPASQGGESIFKVFSDDSTGVVCYWNERGEMVCEGPDEGPHFNPQFGSKDASSSIYVPENQAAEIMPIFGQLMYEI
eukprot:c37264_g1_i1 orf=259-648(-)